MVRSSVSRLEYATAQDPSLNYCLWPYRPPAPVEDKWRSVNLLYHSLDRAGSDPRVYDIIDAIRAGIGSFQTVFGIKLAGGALTWEYYFYDYKRLDRTVSISQVLHATRDLVQCDLQANEQLPYFMFSLDMSEDIARGSKSLDLIHIYIGNPGSAVSSGIAYAVCPDQTVLENFYFFFDAKTQGDEIAKKVASSAFFDATRFPIEMVLNPVLRHCTTICLANKRFCDCIYFSGISVFQLIWFLSNLDYPRDIIEFVENNKHNLDHLQFDVGLDYKVEHGRFTILKSGYYGVF